MEKSINSLLDNQMEMEITLTGEELQPHFEQAYKEIQPKVDMKGFRKGKVPIPVIKKMYGKAVEFDAIPKIATEYFNKIVKEENIKFVGEPQITDLKEHEGGYKIFIKYEVIPDFVLSEYRGLQVEEPFHRVTDEEIEHEIEHILINNGNFVDAEEATDELFLVGIQVSELDKETGVKIIGAKTEKTDVFLHDHKILPELKEQLMHKKIGETFNFYPRNSDSNSPDKLFNIEITSVKKLIPQELTDDWVKQYTKEAFLTIEEFKQDIGFKLQESWDDKSRKEIEKQIVNILVEKNDFEPPSNIVKQYALETAKSMLKSYSDNPAIKDIDPELFAQDLMPMAKDTVKWELISQKIIERESITAEDYDFDQFAQIEADRLKSDIEAVKKNLKKNPQLNSYILNKKLFDFLIDFAITTEITFDDFYAKRNMDGYDYHDHDHNHDHEHDHDHDHEHDHDHNVVDLEAEENLNEDIKESGEKESDKEKT